MAIAKNVKQLEHDKFIDITDDNGDSVPVIGIVVYAEDINNAGVYMQVQGQVNDDGNFELLTAGSAAASESGEWNATDTNWNSTSSNWNQT